MKCFYWRHHISAFSAKKIGLQGANQKFWEDYVLKELGKNKNLGKMKRIPNTTGIPESR